MNPTPRSLAARAALRVAFAVLALGVAASPARALEDKAQQSCLNAVTKGFAAMTKAEAKEAAICIKLASMEALPQPSVEACIAADAKGKVAGSRTKAAAAIAKACTKAPSFGTSDLTGATAVSGASGVRTALLRSRPAKPSRSSRTRLSTV